jgi:hypothetical protein
MERSWKAGEDFLLRVEVLDDSWIARKQDRVELYGRQRLLPHGTSTQLVGNSSSKGATIDDIEMHLRDGRCNEFQYTPLANHLGRWKVGSIHDDQDIRAGFFKNLLDATPPDGGRLNMIARTGSLEVSTLYQTRKPLKW